MKRLVLPCAAFMTCAYRYGLRNASTASFVPRSGSCQEWKYVYTFPLPKNQIYIYIHIRKEGPKPLSLIPAASISIERALFSPPLFLSLFHISSWMRQYLLMLDEYAGALADLNTLINNPYTIVGGGPSAANTKEQFIGMRKRAMELEEKFRRDHSDVKRERPQNLLWRVGQTFRHKKYNYRGVIYGWDTRCEASEDWITHQQVRTLASRTRKVIPVARIQPHFPLAPLITFSRTFFELKK